MLELEIKGLREEVKNLTSVFAELVTILRNEDITTAKRQSVAAPVEQKTTVAPEEVVKVEQMDEAPKTATITRDDVQALCTTLMRKDRGLKDQIKGIIATFDGATNLITVAEKNLASLHAKLSELL